MGDKPAKTRKERKDVMGEFENFKTAVESGNIEEMIAMIRQTAKEVSDEEVKERILLNADKIEAGYEDTLSAAVQARCGRETSSALEDHILSASKNLTEEQILELSKAHADVTGVSSVSEDLENVHAQNLAKLVNETLGNHPVRDTFEKLKEENVRHAQELKDIFVSFEKGVSANLKIGKESARQGWLAAKAAAINATDGVWESLQTTSERLTDTFKKWGKNLKEGVLKAGMFAKNAINKATYAVDVFLDTITFGVYGNVAKNNRLPKAYNFENEYNGKTDRMFNYDQAGYDELEYPNSFITKIEKGLAEIADPLDARDEMANFNMRLHNILAGVDMVGCKDGNEYVDKCMDYWDRVRETSFGVGKAPADKIAEFDRDISAKIMEKSEKISKEIKDAYKKGFEVVVSGIKSVPVKVGSAIKTIKHAAENFGEMVKQSFLTAKKSAMEGLATAVENCAGYAEKVQNRYTRRKAMLEKKLRDKVEDVIDVSSKQVTVNEQLSAVLTESTYEDKFANTKAILEAAAPTTEIEKALKEISEYNARKRLTHDIISAPAKGVQAAKLFGQKAALNIHEKSLMSDIEKYDREIFGAQNSAGVWENLAGKMRDVSDDLRDKADSVGLD